MFAAYHMNYDLHQAEYVLAQYERQRGAHSDNNLRLPDKSFVGLRAELLFYDKYRKDLRLTVSNDAGDKADFTGYSDGNVIRIDVTTNLRCKDISNYCIPMKQSEIDYFLYELDASDGSIVDKVKLNMPAGENLRNLRPLVDLAVLRGPEYDKDGCCRYNPYQELFKYDVHDGSVSDCKIMTDWYIEDFGTFEGNLADAVDTYEEDVDIAGKVEKYGKEVARFLTREYNCYILGLLAYEYRVTSPDGDGEYGYYFKWLHPLMANLGFSTGSEFV